VVLSANGIPIGAMSFIVSEEDAAAIRTALLRGGLEAATAEVLSRFRFIEEAAEAARWAAIIAGWSELKVPPRKPAGKRKPRSG
jgi:hypothetical protein